ncbi:MAG: type V CRISPR-associated protein Cas4 [Ignavibacteria bacterium]|jgi:CRISPR-associated protein Cas4|nr:type V CRISPR-associated protein Cas4 [Ignavibacteria bacterium]
MDEYIAISLLNDFIFCPYSIYLHNVYMGGDEGIVHSTPQATGKSAHSAIDNNQYSTKKSELTSLSVYSDELGIAGKIDIYKADEKLLTERKYKLTTIYQGQIFQLWAQYFCMLEMGYQIEKLTMHSISTNQTFPIEIPSAIEKSQLINFINEFKNYNPEKPIKTNENKCKHCIYCNLCDKSEVENVY